MPNCHRKSKQPMRSQCKVRVTAHWLNRDNPGLPVPQCPLANASDDRSGIVSSCTSSDGMNSVGSPKRSTVFPVQWLAVQQMPLIRQTLLWGSSRSPAPLLHCKDKGPRGQIQNGGQATVNLSKTAFALMQASPHLNQDSDVATMARRGRHNLDGEDRWWRKNQQLREPVSSTQQMMGL